MTLPRGAARLGLDSLAVLATLATLAVLATLDVACRARDDAGEVAARPVPTEPANDPMNDPTTDAPAAAAPVDVDVEATAGAARPPEVALDPTRPCGEAGPTPTALPPALASGLAPVGRGVVAPGATVAVQGVRFTFDMDAWIGLRSTGHRGPALAILIDAAEANGGPYGDQVDVAPGRTFRATVGPYQIDGTIPEGEPLGPIEVVVRREVCPSSATIEAGTAPLSLWVSTEAIRLHTYDLSGELLQVGIDGPGEAPRLDLSRLGYRTSITPRPGAPWRVRLADHWVTVDQVTPGPGTRYDGEWHADRFARAHARVWIEPAARRPLEAPTPALPCGAPSPTRSALPVELTRPLKVDAERTLAPARPERLGDLGLTYSIEAYEGRRDYRGERETEYAHRLTVVDHREAPPRHVAAITTSHGTTYVRDRQDLLRVDPTLKPGAERLRVRHVLLACTDTVTLPRPSAPIHAWLSTVGARNLVIGDPRAPTAQLQVYADPRQPSLGVSFEGGYLSETLRPESVGLTFSIGDLLLEIVDVEVGPGTRRVEYGWETSDLLPVVHVQVRLSPAAP
ncbi:MAG: hypothetical protein R3B09_04800 [Nannocystaceae bacterium]